MRQHKLHLTHRGIELTQCVSTWLSTLQRKAERARETEQKKESKKIRGKFYETAKQSLSVKEGEKHALKNNQQIDLESPSECQTPINLLTISKGHIFVFFLKGEAACLLLVL